MSKRSITNILDSNKEDLNNNNIKKSKTMTDELAINTIRILSAEMVQQANSGHPGAPMGCAPIGHLLFSKVMNYNPQNPSWFARDRFVLSNGHACALQYALLHLSGYNVSLDDLKNFRQVGSITPGHPENFVTPGIEVSTGPLGQGITNAVGLAIAEKHLAARYNKEGEFSNLINNFTYVICGDGCLQEGVSSEASSLAGHLGLGKLIVFYDDNSIQIDGSTDLAFTEDVSLRYQSYGWQVLYVNDVTDQDELMNALNEAKSDTEHPTMIRVKTIIGHGSSKAGSHKVHGSPLGSDVLANMKSDVGFNPEEFFHIPDDVSNFYNSYSSEGINKENDWNNLFNSYRSSYPNEGLELERRINGELPDNWQDNLIRYTTENKAEGSRKYSGAILNSLAPLIPEIVGGSADLTPSNNTELKCSHDFQKDTPDGRYIRFGVREHAMASICNGMFAYGGMRPYCATFLNFVGYAIGAIRLSALSNFGIIYIMTHDSIGLGEDGPTHQPIETLPILRSMPNILTFRPADGNEVSGSYKIALENSTTPSVLCLSRQNVPNLNDTSIEKTSLGGYTLTDSGDGNLDLILVASGSEVNLCLQVANSLNNKNVRVVSMPCTELFDQQDDEYKLSVFPDGVPVLSVEASSTFGWERYAHATFGIERFGQSGPGGKVFEMFGFTVDNLVNKANDVMNFYSNQPPTSCIRRVNLNLLQHGHH